MSTNQTAGGQLPGTQLQTEAARAESLAVPVKGLAIASGARPPGRKARTATPRPAEQPETAKAESPAVPVKGLGIASGAKRPGGSKTATQPATTVGTKPADSRKASAPAKVAIGASIRASKWFKLIWITPILLVLLLAGVFIAQWLRQLPAVQSFMTTYPGESKAPDGTPIGFPAWLGWQHFFNILIMLLLIRSGWMVHTNERPSLYWTRNNSGIIRTKNPPKKMSIDLWFHLVVGSLLVLNGIIFYVLMFTTGQWKRLIPTRLDVLPNALSTAIQYASLSWPTENGWVNYNSLQLLAYSSTVFIAVPLAIVTGVRMSSAWPVNAKKLNKLYPIEVARAIHFPAMLYIVLFIIVHVAMVFATSALNNLNHMFAARNDNSWVGFWIFAVALVVMVAVWIAARPAVVRPIAALTGQLSRR